MWYLLYLNVRPPTVHPSRSSSTVLLQYAVFVISLLIDALFPLKCYLWYHLLLVQKRRLLNGIAETEPGSTHGD